MSDVPNDPTGATGGGGDEQPSQEEVRAYLEQLRSAPVEQVVAEVASALLNAAQVKLGRRDGRLLIDIVAAITERGREALPAEIIDQLDQALTQLRLSQVEAEREVAEAASQGQQEPSDIAEDGAEQPEAPPSQPQGTRTPPSSPSGGSRLWVPGS